MQVLVALWIFLASVNYASAGSPDKIYGVNIGGWLITEPWMNTQEWLDMGGQECGTCSDCIASEFSYVKANPKTADAAFAKHWNSWFTQDDVDWISAAGLNTVRIPLGFWLVEPLVYRSTEFYPRGGIKYLKSRLKMLKKAGIQVILDHHGLPGVQTAQQSFTGHCTNDVKFYTQHNYHRALIWTAVMTAMAHLDPDFGSVFAIEAVNEEIQDATKTPGYGEFQKNFVQTVRTVELALGISVPGWTPPHIAKSANFTEALAGLAKSCSYLSDEVKSVLTDAIPMVEEVGGQLGILDTKAFVQSTAVSGYHSGELLATTFMDVKWQYTGSPIANPADAAIGSQLYDGHLYLAYGGVAANATPQAYLEYICNENRIAQDADLGDNLLVFGEWSLATQFADPTDHFLSQFADAQKLMYSQGKGWIAWNFKVENSTLTGELGKEWSYYEGLQRGYFTQDPTALNNPAVCDSWRKTSESSKSEAQKAVKVLTSDTSSIRKSGIRWFKSRLAYNYN